MRQELEDRLKDLEVEVICARAREEKAERVVEELTRIQTDRELVVSELFFFCQVDDCPGRLDHARLTKATMTSGEI